MNGPGPVPILALVTLTSGAALLLGRRRPGSGRDLRASMWRLVEGVGLGTAFLAVNLVLGVLIIRSLGPALGPATSVYTLDDPVLVALSMLQGFALRGWLDRG